MTAETWNAGLLRGDVERIVWEALAEDLPWGDVTSDNLIAATQQGTARIEARQDGVIAGLGVAGHVFEQVDPTIRYSTRVSDGEQVARGQIVATADGSLRSLLRAERVALNFLQRLSGIATATARYVRAVEGTGARVIDTRKTTPGLRSLEKYAVRLGGGQNHRYCLSDAVLIKDNHLAALRLAGKGLADAVAELRRTVPHTTTIEVEVENRSDLLQALAANVDAVLLDNMTLDEMAEAVTLVAGRAITEASGGITLKTIRQVAETGVDVISVGALTHSVVAFDLSMEIEA
jgi:nicotinate-nucleotide pyrophosphorylase (carboxylating)